MTFDYSVSVNYFDFLSGSPKAWQLVIDSGLGVKRGDKINVIEVDGDGVPTGNTMIGTVRYISTEVVFTFVAKDTLLFVIPD